MALEKVNDPADVLIHSKNGKYNAIVPLKRIQQPREQYDKMEAQFFERRLNELNRAQKDVNLDDHQEKFEKFKQTQEEKIRRLKEKDLIEQRTLKEEMRKIQLNKLQRNMAFMEDWNQKGIENWKKNQDIRKRNLQADNNFKNRNQEKTIQKLTVLNQQTQKEMIDQIDHFEATIGIQDEEDLQSEQHAQSTSPLKQPTNLSVPQVRVHQQKQVTEFLRKERDKRRRKMIVDQEKSHGELQRREAAVLQKLKQQSRQEKEILYEVWRAYRCKDIIVQNRVLRDEKYRQKQELNIINIKYKEEEMLRTIKNEFQTDLELQLSREREIKIHDRLILRKQNFSQCSNLVNVLVEMSENIYDLLQIQDTEQISQEYLEQCYQLFEEGKSLIPPKNFRTYDPLPQIKVQEQNFNSEKDYLADCELNQYINGQGRWAPSHQQITGDGPNAGDPSLDDKFVPNRPINNLVLGNLIRWLIECKFSNTEKQNKINNMPLYLPFRCALLGYCFSGKKTISELLAKKYNIELISVNSLINELLEYYNLRNSQQQQYRDEEMFSLANEIHNCLFNGQDISDELYVKSICLKIRRIFPQHNQEEVFQQYSQIKQDYDQENANRIQSLNYSHHDTGENAELEIMHREDFHKRNLSNIRVPYHRGFLLVDFPRSYNQAKLFEKYLTGFQPDDEIPQSQLKLKLEQAAKIVKPEAVQIIKRNPIEGGIPLVVYLNLPDNKFSLKRALGRRYDEYTKQVYHLEENPPPVDNAPLVERLQSIYLANNLEQTISDKNSYLIEQFTLLDDWYGNFSYDDYKKQRTLKTFQKVDASKRIEEVFYKVDQLVQIMLEISEQRILQQQERKEQQQLLQIQEEEARKAQVIEDAKWVPTEYSKIQEKLLQAIQEQKIEQKSIQILYWLWDRIETNYLKHTRKFFKSTYEQRQLINTRIKDIQLKFIDLLTKPDQKFFLVQKYQESYNQFANENPDMLEEDQTKEELHQRVEDLSDQLGDLVEQKRDDALDERKKTQEFGWIEGEMERFLQEIQRLVQAEIDRTILSIQILNDYYTLLDSRELSEIDTQPPEIQVEALPIESADDPNMFPRLDKIISEALKVINQDEETILEDKNKKGAKTGKKDDKKGVVQVALKKGVQQIEETKKEISAIEQEGTKAMNIEKAIFRYRVQVIKDFAIRSLKEMRILAKQLYQKMEDWAYYTYQCELDAIKVMSVILKNAIEKEEKIQKEVQLNFVDVVVSHLVLNYLTPIPPPLPAREPTNNNRLSISQLYHLIEDLRAITSNQMTIEAKQIVLVFGRKQQSLQKEDLCETLQISTTEWIKAISKLQSNGYVPVKTICTYLILLNSPILTHKERQQFNKSLQEYAIDQWIEKEQFVNCNAWFDSYEGIPEEDNTNYFDRTLYIKELLFFVHKDPDQESLYIPSLLDTLQIKNFGNSKTYYEYLFSQQ